MSIGFETLLPCFISDFCKRSNQYPNDLALAQELAAKFYLTWGKQDIARLYLTNSYYSYARWGATAKVKDLAQNYARLLCSLD